MEFLIINLHVAIHYRYTLLNVLEFDGLDFR